MKKILMILLSCALCIAMISVSPVKAAPSVKYGPNLTHTLDSEGTLTISGTGNMYDRGSGDDTPYFQSSAIKKVVINEGVTSVGNNIFCFCKNLESVTLPNSMKSIGNSSFKGCEKLNEINLPSSISSIGNNAFELTALETVHLPEGIKSIEYQTFSRCKKLKRVDIPETVKTIKEGAFYECTGLVECDIPDGVTTIESSSFWFTSLKNLYIPSSVTSIDSFAFTYNDFLSIQVDPNNTVYDSRNNCNAIIETATNTMVLGCTNTVFPTDVDKLGPRCFQGQQLLVSIEIPDTIVSMGNHCFASDDNLKDVYFSKSLTNIGVSAFSTCTSLTSVTIPASVEKIEMGAFNCCANLEEVILTKGLKIIESSAFYGDPKLEEITIPNTVTSIGKDAFWPDVINTALYDEDPITVVKLMCGSPLTDEMVLAAYAKEVVRLEHDWQVVVEKEPTCTETGLSSEKVCSICEEVSQEQETIPALGHDFGDWTTTKEATCKEKGLEERVCSRCSEKETRDIEMLESHTPADPVRENEKAPTCAETGSYDEVVYCSVCDKELSRETKEIEKTEDHTPGNPVRENEKNPTCTEEGSYDEVVYCTVCNKELSREGKTIEKAEHTEEVIAAVAPTCTETGLTEGKKCSVCGEILVKQQEVSALGHDYEGEVTTEPTCTEKGVKTYTCKNDASHTYTEEIEALGHEMSDWAVTKAATCTEAGEEERHCTRDNCQCSETRELAIDPEAHKSVEVEEVPATCTEAGVSSGTKCELCGKTLSGLTEIPALGHDFGEWETLREPTCEEDGIEVRYCSRCQETEENPIPATGHNPETVKENETPATTEHEGSYDEVIRCKDCGKELDRRTVIVKKLAPATGDFETMIVLYSLMVSSLVGLVMTISLKKKFDY